MTIEALLEAINDKLPPAPEEEILAFEKQIGERLPEDYRDFLVRCNGGSAGGNILFIGPTPSLKGAEAVIHCIGGFRSEGHFSLMDHRDCYQGEELRIPLDLIWIMSDPGGNAICIGIWGEHRNKIYFWDHELELDAENWDGRVETAENLTLLANSFTEFIVDLFVPED